MKRSGHTFVGGNNHASLFDGQLNSRSEGHLYKQLAYRVTRRSVWNAMDNFRDDDSASQNTGSESSLDENVASPAVLTPGRATSSIKTTVDIDY